MYHYLSLLSCLDPLVAKSHATRRQTGMGTWGSWLQKVGHRPSVLASWRTLKKCQAPSPEVRLIGPGMNICKAPTRLQIQPERRLTSHSYLKPRHSGTLGRWRWVGCSVLKLLIPANPCTGPINITPSAVLSTWRHR